MKLLEGKLNVFFYYHRFCCANFIAVHLLNTSGDMMMQLIYICTECLYRRYGKNAVEENLNAIRQRCNQKCRDKKKEKEKESKMHLLTKGGSGTSSQNMS